MLRFVIALMLAFVPVCASAQIAPGVLQPAAELSSVTGTVLNADSTPITGAAVQLTGPARTNTTTDSHGAFAFRNVPNGRYLLTVSAAGMEKFEQSDIEVAGDIALTIRYAQKSAGLKTIAQVATQERSNALNTTAASIESVNPQAYALDGNVSWRRLLEGIPGVAVSGALAGGDETSVVIPDSPFQPIVLSINGALPYETSTTLDGMPLSNYSLATTPGAGVDLSELPMSLFDTADVVRGPGANAPSIVGSIGGSFVLHPPGNVEKNSVQASITNDPYGGYFSTIKATFRTGKLFATLGYSSNTSPGPYGITTNFGIPTYPGASVSINGTPVQNTATYLPSPIYGNCYCTFGTDLLARGGTVSTQWVAHNGGIALGYNLSKNVTAEIFYAGAQATAEQTQPLFDEVFAPGAGYTGSLAPSTYPGSALFVSGANPQLQSASLVEEKITSYLGRGTLQLAALQNYTYDTLNRGIPGPTNVQLFGTGSYCDDATCSTTTPFTFNGQSATLTFSPFVYSQTQRSTNDDFLASYETEVGNTGYIGGSWVHSANSATQAINLALVYNGTPLSIPQITPVVTQSVDEYRIQGGFRPNDNVGVDASYYFTNANYHVPNPSSAASGSWVDSRFSYSAPRVGLTWQPQRNLVVRAAAGGGFALPPMFFLVGSNGQETCSTTACYIQVTNLNLRPETSFGWNIGSDVRLAPNTIGSLDVYRTNLYGQLYQSQNFIGTDPQTGLPLYAQGYLNLAASRYEGINLSLKRDPSRGVYFAVNFGLTRGYVVTLPPGFYNENGGTCNYTTGDNCTNTNVIPGPNFNGAPGLNTTVFTQAPIPYANGSALVGYKWSNGAFADITGTYFGNNNAYFQPAFMAFDARASYRFPGRIRLIATFKNFTGIHDQTYQLLQANPAVAAPTITGFPLPQYALPYGPRALLVTANLDL